MQGLQRFTSIFKISQGPATSLPETLDLRNAANTRTPIRNSNSENEELESSRNMRSLGEIFI